MFTRISSALSLVLIVGCATAPERKLAEPATALHVVAPSGASSQPLHGVASPEIALESLQSSGSQNPNLYSTKRAPSLHWSKGQTLMQGFLGVSGYSNVEVEDASIDGDDGDLDQLPVLGGGAQWKLGGERVDIGIEGLLAFSWRANAEAYSVGGGTAVVVDVDMSVFELYGGPFMSFVLGDKWRAYVAAGPVMQWVDYDQSGNSLDEGGSGFGSGWYARTGLEFALPTRTLIGFGVRWSDTSTDLGGSLGDLEMDGIQALITFSQGL
jgi:opacity protein-like surface antigen